MEKRAEIRTVPYVSLTHPFAEGLIGAIRREHLDHTLFWTTADLENKLFDFRTYFNNHRAHNSLEGRTPDTPVSRPVANLRSFRWHLTVECYFQTPVDNSWETPWQFRPESIVRCACVSCQMSRRPMIDFQK